MLRCSGGNEPAGVSARGAAVRQHGRRQRAPVQLRRPAPVAHRHRGVSVAAGGARRSEAAATRRPRAVTVRQQAARHLRRRLRHQGASLTVLDHRHLDLSSVDCSERSPFKPVRLVIYRVAQNKIPHRRICNISATSGLILKTFEAA